MADPDESSFLATETNESSTTIEHLNDDCLLEICQHLELSDLCTFADVCRRFQFIAKNHFGSVKSATLQQVKMIVWVKLSNRTKCSLLRNFGPSINSLKIRGTKKNDLLWIEMITEYCSGTLNALTLDGFRFDEEIVKNIARFVSLKKLRIRCCYGRGLNGLIQTFPELEEFADDSLNLLWRKNGEFLMKNPQLKRICDTVYDRSRMALIAKYLPAIENLTIGLFTGRKFITQISSLKKLKDLKILDNAGSSGTSTIIEEICRNLDELTNLHFHSSGAQWHKNDLLGIVKAAGKLQTLCCDEFMRKFCIDTKLFERLKTIVEARKEKIRLNMVLVGYHVTMKVPQNLQDACKHSLEIQVESDGSCYQETDEETDEE